MNFRIFRPAFIGALLTLVFTFAGRAQFDPIQIRITAASFSNYQTSGNYNLYSRAGFDVYWNAKMDPTSFTIYPENPPNGYANVLNGSGQTVLSTRDGGPFTGNLSARPGGNPFYEVFYPGNGLITLKIAGPHAAGNNGTQALIEDPTAEPFTVRVPRGSTFFSPVTTESIVWAPQGLVLPNDTDTQTADSIRESFAVVQFNPQALPAVIPVTYVYEGESPDRRAKHVWFGRVTISRGQPVQAPIDPFTLGGYQQATSPNDFPKDPPASLLPQGAQGFSDWIRGLFPSLPNGLSKVFSQIQNGKKSVNVNGAFSYDAKTSLITVSGIGGAVPAAGTLSVAFLVKPKNFRGSGSDVPATAFQNVLSAGYPARAEITVDSKTRRAIRSGKAQTIVVTAKFVPSDGSPAVVVSANFRLKAEKPKPTKR